MADKTLEEQPTYGGEIVDQTLHLFGFDKISDRYLLKS